MADKKDIEIKRGDTRMIIVTVKRKSGPLADLSAYTTARMQVRDTPDAVSTIMDIAGTIDTSNSMVTISISVADSEALYASGERGFYDIEIRNGDDTLVKTIAEGRILATNDVTR